MMRLAPFIVLACPWLFLACASSPPAAARPQRTDEEAPQGNREIEAIFAPYDRAGTPGCAVLVTRDGKLVHAGGYGSANLELAVPITPATVFDLGSTSKQFTAACILLLSFDGKLSLDDEVSKYVPELPDYAAPITLRHLLHHTSGIRDYIGVMVLGGADIADYTTSEDALAAIARQRALDFPPGTRFQYSNSGYFLLSQVVERASGKKLAVFAKERIFDPLGMSNTHYHDDHTQVVARRATGYAPRDGGGFSIEMSDWEQTGDGAVMTTVEDLARWVENFSTGKVGGSRLLEAMLGRGKLSDGKELDYGFGLMFESANGVDVVSHGGAWAGYRAELLRIPRERLAVVCLTNRADLNPSVLARKAAAVLVPAMAAKDAASRPSPQSAPARAPYAMSLGELPAFTGTFHSDELASDVAIALEKGTLVLRARRQPPIPLSPTGPESFEGPGIELAFRRTEGGAVVGFAFSAARLHGLDFVRR